MSEYWKSTPKYWCKHCSIYVKDTPFERKQHENTGKHQGSLKRFLRGLQNDHERGEREKGKAKAEVERLNRVVGGGDATDKASVRSTVRKPDATTLSAADQKKQWAQLAEMGVEVPDEFRKEAAMPGNWEVVSKRIVSEESTHSESLNVGVRKRKHDDDDEDEEEQSQEQALSSSITRPVWGKSIKQFPAGLDVDVDDLISTANRISKQEKNADTNYVNSPDRSQKAAGPSTKNTESGVERIDQSETDGTNSIATKSETESYVISNNSRHDLPDPPAPIFKKRKAKVQTNG